jgi:hypothetical protein
LVEVFLHPSGLRQPARAERLWSKTKAKQMTLTGKQHREIIEAHWKLLWPLPGRERMRRLDELIADYEQEEVLQRVTGEMAE